MLATLSKSTQFISETFFISAYATRLYSEDYYLLNRLWEIVGNLFKSDMKRDCCNLFLIAIKI